MSTYPIDIGFTPDGGFNPSPPPILIPANERFYGGRGDGPRFLCYTVPGGGDDTTPTPRRFRVSTDLAEIPGFVRFIGDGIGATLRSGEDPAVHGYRILYLHVGEAWFKESTR